MKTFLTEVRTPSKCPAIMIMIMIMIIIIIKGLRKVKEAGREENARLKLKNENIIFCPRQSSLNVGFRHASEKQR